MPTQISEKRGGMRKTIKKRSGSESALIELLKIKKSTGILPKNAGQYRYLFYTDLCPADMHTLLLFAAWVHANEHYFDSRNQFPILGFILTGVGNPRVKAQRAREFLNEFAAMLQWNKEDHHLYNAFQKTGYRIWYDTDPSLHNLFEDQSELITTTADIFNDDYPAPQPLSSCFSELWSIKPSGVFTFYLKQPNFAMLREQNNDLYNWLMDCPSAILHDNVSFKYNAITINADIPIPQLMITTDNCPKMMRHIVADDTDIFTEMVRKCMYVWNDYTRNEVILTKLSNIVPDINSNEPINMDLLSNEVLEMYADELKLIDEIQKTNSRVLPMTSQALFIAFLIATGIATNPNISMVKSTDNPNIYRLSVQNYHSLFLMVSKITLY